MERRGEERREGVSKERGGERGEREEIRQEKARSKAKLSGQDESWKVV